ncbi:MAG: MFS transporter, partial [Actinobacteria bacterium]|nr:MFS transporter [Actinomycetota bacterium]
MPAHSADRPPAEQRLAQQQVRRWSIAIIAVFAVLGFGFGTWLSRLPAVRDHLGATTLEMSVYGLSMGIGSLVGLAFSGRAVAWFGARRTLLVCLSAQAVAMVATINVFWIEQVGGGMALLFTYGFFFSISDVAANVSGAEAERAVGRPRMPIFHGCYSLGAVATMGLGAAAEAAHVAAPVHVSIVILFASIVGLIALRWIPRDHTVGEIAPSAARPAGSAITGPI